MTGLHHPCDGSSADMSPENLPSVGIVLVNYRGADDVIECVNHLNDLDYPKERIEVIVVDNDSGDGSEERIRSEVPHVRVLQSGTNRGFAGGCNFGVANCQADIIAFINSDARPDREWVSAAVAVLASDPGIGCVASRVLDWDGSTVDYVDGALSWFGMGYKREVLQPAEGQFLEEKNVLFATGAAMFVPRAVFNELGGFDERFFMFFEDVDFGWRLNLLGYTVRYSPASVAYHRHHVAIKKFGAFRETYLLERNALLAMYKNLGSHLLQVALGAAIALSVARAKARGDQNSAERETEGWLVEVPKEELTGPYSIEFLLRSLPELSAARQQIQHTRTVADEQILPLFRNALNPLVSFPGMVDAHQNITEAFGVDRDFHLASRVLVVTGDVLSDRMAGPAIRAWEMATALARSCEVRLVSTTAAKRATGPGFEVHTATGPQLLPHVEWCDVLVFQGYLLWEAPWIREHDIVVIADIYDPFHLEQLEQARDLGEAGRAATVASATQVLNDQILRADYMLCASEKQRAFWIGQAAAMGRVNQSTVRQYEAFKEMIKVVPFGLGDQPPVQRKHGIRGKIAGIDEHDKVILWGGGVYNWFDPLTLVRAVNVLSERHDDIRLYFMGLKHPNPAVPEMKVAWELRELSDSLGLTDRIVFFNKGWVPYAERADVLLDADIGVSTHYEHVETAYSFRTRILDYLWAGLPIVATTGDSFGNILTQEGIGIGVPPEDVDALAEALETLLYDDEKREAARTQVRRFAEQYKWECVLRPLVDFANAPARANDLLLKSIGKPTSTAASQPVTMFPSNWRGDLRLFREYLRTGGIALVATRVQGRLRKRRAARR